MPSYTNPQTIDTGTQKSAPELQSNFDAIQVALNGGLDEVNVPNLAAAFTTYEVIQRGAAIVPTQGAGGTFLSPAHTSANIAAQNAAGTAAWAFRLDPARFAANARTTKLLLHTSVFVNATPPATNFVGELRSVASFGGLTTVTPTINTVGAVLNGAGNAHNTPAGGSATAVDSADFNFPAAGWYCFTMTIGGGMAAGSQIVMIYELLMRRV